MTGNFWMLWPENPGLSLFAALAAAMIFLYAARAPMHELIRSSSRALSSPLRLAARWLAGTAAEMGRRNKAVLLAHARQEVENRIEREFQRIEVLVRRDLEGYPALQRRLMEEITRIEEDYRKCGEVPPPPPDWVEAVAAVAGIKSGTELVEQILGQIRTSIERIHDKAIGEYRKSYQSRHRILDGFMPFWRSVEKTMQQVDKKLAGLQACASSVDAHMEKYQQIAAQTDRASHALTVSSFTQFAIAGIVMAIAAGGAFINFKLIALPMSEMVGAGDVLAGGLRTSEVAALVIILVEASMGLFVMETLRITHLFPPIHNLSDRMRRRMLWTAFSLLVTLALVEAALALMRDVLIADKQALVQSLAGVPIQAASATDGWVGRIPTAGQMLLGFILPFALAFIAIPLESLVHSSRTVGGVLVVVPVRLASLVLRLAGSLTRQLGRVLIGLYDVAIVIPLLVERISRAVFMSASKRNIHDDEDVVHRRAG